ncbi:hypothetical protein HYV71_01755 [Candidatus Uhrbacteria bacterium]|nr:hypothetical protein [Candidatus Uhrbacteria bacterium]
MRIRRTDFVKSEPSDRRDPNAVAPSLANFEQFGPQLLGQRKGHLRNLNEKYKAVLSSDKIAAILDITQTLKQKHSEQKGYSSISRDAELLFWQTAELYQWLGEYARVLATSDYDDVRGVADYYLQKYDPNHPEKNFELLIDIAVGEGGKGRLAVKEAPFAKAGSLDELRRKDPDRAELFELDGVRRKAMVLQAEAVDVFPAYPGFSVDSSGAPEVGLKAPAIVVSLSEKEIDKFLKSIYSNEDKKLKPNALSGDGLELAEFRKHILERIHSAIKRQIAYLDARQGSFSVTNPDEFTVTKAALNRAEAYFFQLLADVKKGIKGNRRKSQPETGGSPAGSSSETGPSEEGHTSVPERVALSFDELSRIAKEAHENAQHALTIREKISVLRDQAAKIAHSVSAARRAEKKLEAAMPFDDDTKRNGEFLIARGLLWEHVDKRDRARMVKVYTEQLTNLRDAVEVLSGLEAPSRNEKRQLAEYQKTLAGVDAIVSASLAEYQELWRQKRDVLSKRIHAHASERVQALKALVFDSLKDREIFARLQEHHPDMLKKIEHAIPGITAQAQARIETAERGKEHQSDFFRKLIEKIRGSKGGIDTYLEIQNELFGKLDSVISPLKQSGEQETQVEEASILWDAIDEYIETKNINSPLLTDLKYKLLDIIAQDQALPMGGLKAEHTLENYLRIIQRADYISFLATLQAFIAELNTEGLFEKIVPDQAERRKIISKVTAFIDNHDVLEALAGDVLEIINE